jgi:DNA primase
VLSHAELKARVDLRDLVAQRWGPGTRVGKAVQFKSRWRDDGENGSFTVYADGYKDFGGSGEHGDVFAWIMNEYGLPYKDAVRWLRDYIGEARPVQPQQQTFTVVYGEPPYAEWQRAITAEAIEPSAALLFADQPASRAAYNYLRYDRCLTDETIRKYRVGFSPKGRTLRHQKDGSPVYQFPGLTIPRFADGALFAVNVRLPVGSFADALGVPSMKRRDGKDEHKYKNLTGSLGAGVLFNADAITPGTDVLFVEGEFDAMLAQQEIGDDVAAVTFGSTSNVKTHIPKRWHDRLRAARRVYLALDRDGAGEEANARLTASLREIGIEPMLLPVPAGKDVTDYVRDHDGDLAAWWAARATTAQFPIVMHDQSENDYWKDFRPLTLRQAALFMVAGNGAENYPLIELHVRAKNSLSFTIADLADATGKSADAAEEWVAGAIGWGAVSELSEDFSIRVGAEDQVLKNAVNSPKPRGPAPKRYVLTPERAMPLFAKYLVRGVERLAERPTPGTVEADELRTADPQIDAKTLELVTSEITRSIAADEVVAENERRDEEKARELLNLAELDETPFQPEELPCSVGELRVALWETLHATDPTRANWKHSEIMWVIGLKQKSVAGTIKKSSLTPAALPTFEVVMLKDIPRKNLYQEARKACRKHGGAGVSWVDRFREPISKLSPYPPEAAAGVQMNCGKRYFRRADVEQMPADSQTPDPQKKQTPGTPEEVQARREKHARDKNRAALLLKMRGCLVARGYERIIGPYPYWQRRVNGQWYTYADDWQGVSEALLQEREWAEARRAERAAKKADLQKLIATGIELGAQVRPMRVYA